MPEMFSPASRTKAFTNGLKGYGSRTESLRDDRRKRSVKIVMPKSLSSAFIDFMKNYYVYIMSNKKNGTLYIGVTNDLIRRVYEHKNKLAKGFTEKYGLTKLVYYEHTESIEAAIVEEKRLKDWHRSWKIRLINKMNPAWDDLYDKLL